MYAIRVIRSPAHHIAPITLILRPQGRPVYPALWAVPLLQPRVGFFEMPVPEEPLHGGERTGVGRLQQEVFLLSRCQRRVLFVRGSKSQGGAVSYLVNPCAHGLSVFAPSHKHHPVGPGDVALDFGRCESGSDDAQDGGGE